MNSANEPELDCADTIRRRLVLAGLGGLAAQIGPPLASAQDATKVMPGSYRVALENDYVRVLEFTGKPGMGVCGEGWHSHPPHIDVVLSDFVIRGTFKDGTTREGPVKLGDVFWKPAVTHKAENVGGSVARLLIVELKAPALAKA